jgi:thymidine kinase
MSYLELIIGPMYSGKTSELLKIYEKCISSNISVIVINHSIDKRYHNTMMSSHDKKMVSCIQSDNLSEVWVNNDAIKSVDVILINEGQFFLDLYEVVNEMLKYNKKIYVCGLDGDFERKKFGSILDLIPICDTVYKKKALCKLCNNGTPAIFSMRLTEEKEQTVIGSDNYVPVCRKCYIV